MPSDGWEYRPLGDLTENFDFKRVPVKGADRRPGPYPYYGASGVVDHIDGYLFDGEYLLIAEDGENLRTRTTPVAFLARGKFWVNNHAHIVQGNDRANTKFLMYALANADISGYLTGSTMPKLTQGSMNRIPILAPSRDEQDWIVSILDSLDAKIDLNRRMNETLDAIARALFQSWFVDFAPVRARAEGRRPHGLDAEAAALFPDSFEDSPLGQIPSHWDLEAVYRAADVIYGAPFSSSFFNENGEGMPLLRIRDLTTHDPRVFTTERHPKATSVGPGAIVVGMDGEFRVHQWRGPESLLNQRVCMFVPKPNVPRAFLQFSIQEPLSFFERSKAGTTVIHLGKADIDTFKIILPPKAILKAFAQVTDSLFDRILANDAEVRSLAALRDTLLPKLLSGEIRVADARASVGEVVGTAGDVSSLDDHP